MRRTIDVEVHELSKTYGDTRVVEGITFRLEPGSVTGFVGPNGSGKTTTLKLMLSLIKGEGRTFYGGQLLRNLDSPQRTVGAVLDGRIGHPKMTAQRHLRALARLGGTDDQHVAAVLDQVGLSAASMERLDTFSLGMAQRLNIAAALLSDPAVLIVDEPTNALDPEGVLMVRDAIRRCADRGGVVLFSSHLLSEVEAISDRFMVVSRGALVADAAASEFQKVYGDHRVILRVENDEHLPAVLERLGCRHERLGDRHFAIRGTQAHELGPSLHRSGIAICELRDEYQSLEELFFAITGVNRSVESVS